MNKSKIYVIFEYKFRRGTNADSSKYQGRFWQGCGWRTVRRRILKMNHVGDLRPKIMMSWKL